MPLQRMLLIVHFNATRPISAAVHGSGGHPVDVALARTKPRNG
jgi:hypothetical protein